VRPPQPVNQRSHARREHSRAAKPRDNQTPEDIGRVVLELRQVVSERRQLVSERRQAHMRCGPRKVKWVLERDEPVRTSPASGTIGALLKRKGLVVPRRRKKRVRTAPYSEPLAHADEAHCVRCSDFNGWFPTADGQRIDPLTISNAHTQHLLRCQAVEKTDTARVQAVLKRPLANTACRRQFASITRRRMPRGGWPLARLSRLAVWWISLGIVPQPIAAGHPKQNGTHERMYRRLKHEAAQPPAANRREQQRTLDRFRQEHNDVRVGRILRSRGAIALRRFPSGST
jgi:putative transposase